MDTALNINTSIQIPLSELEFSFSRSGGKGGQNVNKVETKVELRFDVMNSPSLPSDVKFTLLRKLGSRMDQDGVLILTSQTHRSQLMNRDDVTEKFQSLVQTALKKEKPRRPTKPTKSSKERRIDSKKKLSQKKGNRKLRFD